MKLLKKVPAKEVKRCFVIGDLAKPPRGKSFTRTTFIKHLASVKRRVLVMRESALDSYIGKRRTRLQAYNVSTWYVAEVSPREIGVWRRAGGLPLEWTNRTLADTAREVKRTLAENPSTVKKRARTAIPGILHSSIMELPREKYLFPIVFKGGTGTRGRSRLKYKTKGDIDDGCMRSIALAISGVKTLHVYFGVPKKALTRSR